MIDMLSRQWGVELMVERKFVGEVVIYEVGFRVVNSAQYCEHSIQGEISTQLVVLV